MVQITGNTYPVREKLKALGGRWNQWAKCWEVPEAVADQARALVPSQKVCGTRRPKACATCGCRINYGRFCGKCEFS